MSMNQTDEFKTVKDIARILQVSQSTIYRLINSGVIPCMKLSPRIQRIRLSDILSLKSEVIEDENHR